MAALVSDKLIPLMILTVEGRPLPICGDGGNVRHWLYVEDHLYDYRRRFGALVREALG